MNQEDLGKVIGRSQSVANAHLLGDSEPKLAIFGKIAKHFRVNVIWLIHGKGPREPDYSDPEALQLIETKKGSSRFVRSFHEVTRMLLEEEFDADLAFTVMLAQKIAAETDSSSNDVEAREAIRLAVERQREKLRSGLEELRKKLL